MRFLIEQPYPTEESLVPVGQIKLPETFTAHLVEHDDGAPDVSLVFEVRDGSVECREVHIKATSDGHEVRVTGLAGIRVQNVLEETVQGLMYVEPRTVADVAEGERGRKAFATELPWVPEELYPPVRAAEGNYMFPLTAWNGLRDPVRQVREARTARKTKVTPALLREVAEVYRANVAHQPTQAVAEHFDKAHRTATLYVKRAREAGYLGAAIKGKAGER